MTNNNKIKIVLSGSGILYPLHCGALRYITEVGYEIEEISGVSGGSIIAAAVASGVETGRELEDLILDTLPGPNKLLDFTWYPFFHWGLIKGKRIDKVLKKNLPRKFGDTDIPLKVFAVNLDDLGNYGEPLYTIFSSDQTPDLETHKAVRASISLPGIFKPAEIEGHRYIDGGVAANFPLSVYGTGENVFGLHIRSKNKYEKPSGLISYAGTIINIMMDSINREHIDNAMWARITLLRSSTSGINFMIGRDEARVMIEEGYQQAKSQLSDVEL